MPPSLKRLLELLSQAERIGVIGSPSSTSQLSLEILGSAATKKLVGELAFFHYRQENRDHYAFGQITEVKMRNIWHEDPTMRSLIRQRGKVEPISERQDTHQGEMTISAVFADRGERYQEAIMGTVPPTGTPIYIADDAILKALLARYQPLLFYLGTVYGSTPRLPLWFKHFGSSEDGAGEAYHIGIFGKTGSGKSVLAKMIMLAYARHPSMGLMIFDPQGEFSRDMQLTQAPTQMGQVLCPAVLQPLQRFPRVYTLQSIRLDTWETFFELLTEAEFFSQLGIKSANYQEVAREQLETFFGQRGPDGKRKYRLKRLNEEVLKAALKYLSEQIGNIYAQEAGIKRVKDTIQRTLREIDAAKANDFLSQPTPLRIWNRITALFQATDPGRRTPTQIIQEGLRGGSTGKRPLVVIDLSSQRPEGISQSDWDNKIKPLILNRFISELIRNAEEYYQQNHSLNALVLFDEAHRFIPHNKPSEERLERVKRRIVDAVRTTRKYGLGWMFLSQTLSSLDSEVVQQLRVLFLGFGLSMGTEYQRLREIVGDRESLHLYQQFHDPQSAFDPALREYAFMTLGPVSPLSFAGTPLFLRAFTNLTDFLQANNLQIASHVESIFPQEGLWATIEGPEEAEKAAVHEDEAEEEEED
ncbi:MAG: ATP-binding protein [Thermogemmatispora sp.]|uniref:AAA+ ATPase domain-containing protein n=1 Tax=Thermogemmatispora tikiterensis TaxID=1825093 RepID=A0A328VB33_9CHLR|nr:MULTISPECIES: DUF87 domain-containing protein [Thermogemmatispora]MBX5457949.1 ATP-binding protein [Thermogemmatispora sp.]RAQ93951.1 hypothetical protein A4R35_00305 [Thermogemmatispora tikiterensis]